MTDGSKVKLGDHVVVEGNVRGTVICDYDAGACLPGFERWLESRPMADGTLLSSGIMVETSELGFVHYASDDMDIRQDSTPA
ncbi:hypothetical protein [Ramlibacter albus]|uniref:Uncharacterized protein n=1 Tax=Ramlibacter albus TaxID=2079448 RepID=A0A923M814_9BURK|nr:hypothetical protein [Ramlibacter albus]MBC5765972.1 hypothetical protein [Ramlibacter albus]